MYYQVPVGYDGPVLAFVDGIAATEEVWFVGASDDNAGRSVCSDCSDGKEESVSGI